MADSHIDDWDDDDPNDNARPSVHRGGRRKSSVANAVMASNRLSQANRDPVIADVIAMSKSMGQMKRQIGRLELRIRVSVEYLYA
jgi:hypothetical protein